MSPQAETRARATAPLLYWLLIVCGLVGISLQRLDTPNELYPLWGGTLAGVAVGQFIGWLRVRAWVLIAIGAAAFWFSPLFFFILYQAIRGPVETFVYALVPAAICGYLSLSERGGLVAFWYPAVLWMLVILDGPSAGAFDAHAALPFVVGLAGLFVAFLRARETRRVALWRGHSSARLAEPLPRAVLRASPVRAASQVIWTGFAGAAALVLTAWIAPHLWQKDESKDIHVATAAATHTWSKTPGAPGPSSEACCPDVALVEQKHARVREYLPLLHHDDGPAATVAQSSACIVCSNDDTSFAGNDNRGYGSLDGLTGGYASGGSSGGGAAGFRATASPPSPASPTPDLTQHPTPTPLGQATPQLPVPAITPPSVVAPKVATPSAASPSKPSSKSSSSPSSTGASTKPVPVVIVTKPAGSHDMPAPWKSALAFCIGALALHVTVRAIRRRLTLRHLARPFWSETLDQRISNHWQRMLVGLYDAGIHVAPNEQPQELARRVGIDGMQTCATILERVRHGVRVDTDDLDAMDSAAAKVFRAAREKAGVLGRAAAVLRWPLA